MNLAYKGTLGSPHHGSACDHLKKTYSKVEYVQRRVCFVNVKSALHENVVFLFVLAWAMLCISYLSCGIPFPVWMPGIISGLTSVRSHQQKFQVNL